MGLRASAFVGLVAAGLAMACSAPVDPGEASACGGAGEACCRSACAAGLTCRDRCVLASYQGVFTPTGAPAAAKGGGAAVTLQSGKVLLLGGQSSPGAEIFDPGADGGAGAFSPGPPLVTPRHSAGVALLASGKVLVAGGNAAVGGGCVTQAERFDPSADGGVGAFLPAATAAVGCHRFAVPLPSGKVLVFGGPSPARPSVAAAELFDPTAAAGSGAFTRIADLDGLYDGAAVVRLASGKVLIAGGIDASQYSAAAVLFDSSAAQGQGAFIPVGAMGAARWGAQGAALPDGSALIVGGSGASPVGGFWNLGTAEIFTPTSTGGAFTPAPAPIDGRVRGTAVNLADGTVLFAGGYAEIFVRTLVEGGVSPKVEFLGAEVFSPGAGGGGFTATSSPSPMVGGIAGAIAAAPLHDGRVLLVGVRPGPAPVAMIYR